MSKEEPISSPADDFAKESLEARTSLAVEFVDFLKHNKKWWLLPIIVVMGLLGVLMLVGGSGAAPFIYTLF